MANETTIYLLILFIFLVVVLVIFMVLMFMHQNNQIKAILNEHKLDGLKDNQAIKDNLNDELINFSNDLREFTANRLKDIEQSVNTSLIHNFDKTERFMISMSEKMTTINETQKNLNDLSKDLMGLQNILNDKKLRGIFGEVELNSLLENIYGQNEQMYHTQYKLSNGNIADAVLVGPKSLGLIVIDSKFPLENYIRMCDSELAKADRLEATKLFKQNLKKHVDDIASKYLISNETADIAYMFIPSESLFAEIYGKHYDIIEYAYQKHVYIVSSTTLMSYITALKALYLGQVRDEKVKEIQVEYSKLGIEFKRYKERIEKLDKAFDVLQKEFANVLVTSNKLIKRFDQIEKIEIIEGEDNHEFKN